MTDIQASRRGTETKAVPFPTNRFSLSCRTVTEDDTCDSKVRTQQALTLHVVYSKLVPLHRCCRLGDLYVTDRTSSALYEDIIRKVNPQDTFVAVKVSTCTHTPRTHQPVPLTPCPRSSPCSSTQMNKPSTRTSPPLTLPSVWLSSSSEPLFGLGSSSPYRCGVCGCLLMQQCAQWQTAGEELYIAVYTYFCVESLFLCCADVCLPAGA